MPAHTHWRTADQETAATPAQSGGAPLRRVLGPFDATCVVIGAIIGVGIFFNPTNVARLAGSGELALLAWAIGGFIALCGALTFAELGMRYPNAGGQYEILRDCYGGLPAFLFVFCNATAIQAGAIAVIALVCGQNLALAAAGTTLNTLGGAALAAVLILAVTAANAMGVRVGAGIQNLTVIAKLATLLGVAAVAIALGRFPVFAAEGATSSAPGGAAIGTGGGVLWLAALFPAIVPTFFAYGGWQHSLWIAGEVRDPRRNLPLAVVLGVFIVVLAYLAVNWAYLALLGFGGVTRSGALAADAIGAALPGAAARLTAAAVTVSAFGVLNAQLLSGPRLIYRMAADGRFFGFFAGVDARFRTPLRAVWLLGCMGLALLAAAVAFSRDAMSAIGSLITGTVFVDGVFFALTGSAVFILRRRPGAERVGAHLGYPLAPALFVLGELGIVLGAYGDPETRGAALIGVLWIAAAGLIYAALFAGPRRARTPG